MRALLFYFLVMCAVPICVSLPYVGLLIFNWFNYFRPSAVMYAGTGLPWGKLIALAAIIGWLLSRESKSIPVNRITITFLIFFVWTTITTVFADYPELGWEKWFTWAKVVLITLMTLALCDSRQRLHGLIWVIVISLGYYTVRGGVFTMITAGFTEVLGPPASPYYEANGMAIVSLMLMPLVFYLYLHSSQRIVRWILVGAVFLTLLMVVGTGSRGGFVALVVMMAYTWLHSRRKIGVAVMGTILIGVAVLVLSSGRLDGWISEMQSIQDYETDESSQARLRSWQYAINVAKKSPIVAGGFGAFGGNFALPSRPTYALNAHSTYFEVLGEHGYLGVTLFLVLGYMVFRLGGRIRRQVRSRPELYWARDLALMLEIGLIGYFVAGLFHHRAFLDLYYTQMAIMVLTNQVVMREVAAGRKGASAEDLPAWRRMMVPARAS